MNILNGIYVFFSVVCLRVCTSEASHTIQVQYTGQGLVMLENEELRDTEGNSISCTLSGEPYATFTWKWKDGQNPGPEQYFMWTTAEVPTDPKLSTSTLRFLNGVTEAQKREIKTRTIYAIGSHPNDPSKTRQCGDVILSFIWKPEGTPSLSINKDPLVIGDDSTAQLTCQLTDKGNPEGQVRWIKNGNLQSESEYGTEIISIPVTKDIDGDRWQCYYNNTAGDGDYSDEVMINVHWKPLRPSLSKNKETFVIGEDSTARLTCQLIDKGNPEGQVRWIKNGNLQSESEYSTQMISTPVTKDIDDDKWQCYYYNTAGDGDYSDEVLINVHWKPEKPSLSKDKETFVIGKDTEAQLTCQPIDKGNPEGQVRWIKNGNLQSESEYSTEIISIPVTKDIDDDKWQCYYYNTAGDGDYSDEVLINVHWNVSTDGEIKLKAANQDVREGDDVTLEYELTDKGSPEARFTWTHNDTAKSGESNYTLKLADVTFSDSGVYSCYANNSFSKSDDAVFTLKVEPRQEMQIWVYIVIGVCCGIIIIVIIVIVICVVKKKKVKDKKSDSIGYTNRSLQPDNMTGTGPANKPNVEAAPPVYAAVSRGKVLAPIAAGADGSVYSHVDLSKKTARQSLKGLPMSKKAIDRIIFHKKDGYVNMTFQVRKKFIGDIEIGVCRIGDQSCTSKVSKQHDGASKDVVMVLPIEDRSPDSYSIRITFTERGQVTQTVDLTYPYNKNAVNVTVLNDAHGTNASRNDRPTNVVSPSYADVEVEGVPPHPPRQGYPAEGVTYAVMDWDRSQAPGRPPRLSARSQAQEHVVYADVRPGGNVY